MPPELLLPETAPPVMSKRELSEHWTQMLDAELEAKNKRKRSVAGGAGLEVDAGATADGEPPAPAITCTPRPDKRTHVCKAGLSLGCHLHVLFFRCGCVVTVV